jgi:hypothetical protein
MRAVQHEHDNQSTLAFLCGIGHYDGRLEYLEIYIVRCKLAAPGLQSGKNELALIGGSSRFRNLFRP